MIVHLLATARPAPIYLGNPNASNADDMDDDQEGQNASNVNEDDPNAILFVVVSVFFFSFL